MNIFIISDIKREGKSFAPYGFNLAKWLELKEVTLIHTIDSRAIRSVYSVEADSQSFTPGEKFSQQELIQREKEEGKRDIHIMLSSEASRLNYPLKVNTEIEEKSIDEKISELMDRHSDSLFIVCTDPDGFIFNSTREMAETVKNTGGTFLFVPAGQKFRALQNVVLPTWFDADTVSDLSILQTLIDGRAPLLHAIYAPGNQKHPDKMLKEEDWKKIACRFFDVADIRIQYIDGSSTTNTLVEYGTQHAADLLVVCEEKAGKPESWLNIDALDELIKTTQIPLLVRLKAG